MKILHLVYDCVPGSFQGGIQKVVYHLALHQSRLGHAVSVFALFNKAKHGGRAMVFSHRGVNFRYFMPKDGRWKLRARSSELKTALLVEDFDFEVIHSHNIFSPLNRYAVAAMERHGCKLFQHLHGSLLATSKLREKRRFSYLKKCAYIKLFEKGYCNKSNGVFCLSKEEQDDASSWRIDDAKLFILKNGVEILDTVTKMEHRRANLLFMGRITPIKNLEFILLLFAQYKKRDEKNYRLVLAGDMETYPEYVSFLKKEINRLGIQKDVVWMGFVSGTKQSTLFLQADAFIHMSHSEGMPMAVLEALSFGIPTLVSTNCGLEDAEMSNALLRVGLDEDVAQDKLRVLLDNGDTRQDLGINSIDYISRQHDWNAIAKKSLEYYEIL